MAVERRCTTLTVHRHLVSGRLAAAEIEAQSKLLHVTASITSPTSSTMAGIRPPMLRPIHGADRAKWTGQPDLDLGIGRVWDLSRQLDSSSTRLARTRELFRASSAIPGIFPRVIVDGHVPHGHHGAAERRNAEHADGRRIRRNLPVAERRGRIHP